MNTACNAGRRWIVMCPCFLVLGLCPPGLIRSAAQEAGAAKMKTTYVNCNGGERVNAALRRADPGDAIVLQGTCRERVVITKSIVIDGRGTAVVDGSGVSPSSGIAPEFDGLILIEGTTNVTLTGLTVRNSPVNGIRAARGSSVLLRDVTSRDNAMAGIEIVDNSAAEAIDVITRSNAWGIDVLMNSVLVMKGTFTTADNSRNGLVIHQGSVAENRGAHITASNNQLFGVVVGTGSHLAHSQWEAAVGSTLTVSGSGAAGIFLADSSLSTTGDMVITASDNGVGILAVAGSNIASPNGSATFILKHNGVGLNLASGSRATFVGGLEINDNQAGVLVDEATVHVEAAGGLPAAIVGNGLDMKLTFGSRSTVQGIKLGTPLVCDATVLSRGTTTCMP